MRDEAQAVVIGGGVGGTSILYHLAKLGWRDVVLVEQYGLTHGSTWHSAGLVGQLRSTVSLTKMMQYSVGLYADLARETGKDPGWHQLGGLRLASSRERYEEIQRQAGWAKSFGLEMELVSPAEAKQMFPPMSADGVVAAAFIPLDGYLDPSQLTFALADGARLLGADIEQRTRVTGINLRGGRVHEVVTDKGTIRTDVVVNAGGMYAPQIGRMVGVNVPIITYGHEFLVTEAFAPALPPLPTLRDPDRLIYFRTEVGGLIMGGYERNPAPWALDGVPDGFEAQLLPEDWPRFEPLLEAAVERVPAMETAEVPSSSTARRHSRPTASSSWASPTSRLLGRPGSAPTDWPAPAGWAGRWPSGWWTASRASTCGTWTSAASAASTAAATTRWRGRPRCTRPTTTSSTPTTSAPPAGRCGSRRPMRAWPSSARASARSRAGSARTGSSRTRPSATRRCGRAAGPARTGRRRSTPRRWRRASGRALRRDVVRQDRGHRARRRRLPAAAVRNDVDRAVGTVTYTQMLNSRGGIECDFTVTRLAESRFRIVTGTAFGNHDLGWIRGHIPGTGRSRWPTSPRRMRVSACGGRGRATSCSRSRPPTSPMPACRTCAPPSSRSATCPVWRCA